MSKTIVNLNNTDEIKKTLEDHEDLSWCLVEADGETKLSIKIYGKTLFINSNGKLTHGSNLYSDKYKVLNDNLEVTINVKQL